MGILSNINKNSTKQIIIIQIRIQLKQMHGLKLEKKDMKNGKVKLFIIKLIKFYTEVINIKQLIKIRIKIQ